MDHGNTLVLDFETKDPRLSSKMGYGWTTYSDGVMKVLCAGVKINNDPTVVIEDWAKLQQIVDASDTIICHNSSYDVGILSALNILDTATSKKRLIDTIVLSRLFDNAVFSHGLDDLAAKYLYKNKSTEVLGKLAKEMGLVKGNKKPEKTAYENLDLLYAHAPKVIQDYCKLDVDITHELYHFFMKKMYKIDLDVYSDALKCLIASQKRGIPVDLDVTTGLKNKLSHLSDMEMAQIEDIVGGEFSPNSNKQMVAYFTGVGQRPNINKKGNQSIDSEWLRGCKLPVAKHILAWKRYDKLLSTYVLPPLNDNRGIVYPNISLFAAQRTGRMNSSSPNIQNVPNKGEYGSELRTMYIPHPGEKWVSRDFASQEFRLAVEIAHKAKIASGTMLMELYKSNPKYDMHSVVAELMNVDRAKAKALNFGLLYGKGPGRFAEELDISYAEAQDLLSLYGQKVPFIRELDRGIQTRMTQRGYIISLAGRHITRDGMPYQWINKLIQGSGADMTVKATAEIYKLGIIPYALIHDSIEFGATDQHTIDLVGHCMENTYPTSVPFVSDVKIGDSWGTLKGAEDE